MEPRFEVTLIPDRKICHEFGAITARKNAATWVLLGCSLVVLLVLYPLCMVFDGGSAGLGQRKECVPDPMHAASGDARHLCIWPE